MPAFPDVVLSIVLSCLLAPLAAFAAGTPVLVHEGRKIGLAFEADMQRFEKADQGEFARGQIVFTGSSSFVGWKTLQQDMAPLPVLNRAFGGSNSAQLWHYADRAILPRQPKIIVVYIGDNDMPDAAVTVDNYMNYIRLFVAKVRAKQPRTRFVFLANKPSVARWSLWPKYLEANSALKAFCESDRLIEYADITPTLLDEEGVVRQDCYGTDKLHFKPDVYEGWTRVVKPIVERLWEKVGGRPALELTCPCKGRPVD